MLNKELLRVYNIINFLVYLLSNSTILNNRAITYLINSTKLLVLRSFKPIDRVEVIKVESIVLLVPEKRAYLF